MLDEADRQEAGKYCQFSPSSHKEAAKNAKGI